jgi:hypothetical protein
MDPDTAPTGDTAPDTVEAAPAEVVGEQDWDTTSDAVMNELLAELSTSAPADIAETVEAEAAEAPATEQDAAPADAEVAAETAPADEPAEDKSATSALIKLLEKDRELVEVRSQLRTERETFEAEKAAWQEQRSREDVISADALRRVLMTDPSKLLTTLGLAPGRVSQLLIANQLGDKAPPELRQATERAQWEARVLELEAQVAQSNAHTQARAEADRVRAGTTEYVTAGVSTECPTVAEVAKVDRSRVEDEIFQEIVQDAARRASREPNGKPLTFEEAARRVEKRWSPLASAFRSQSAGTTAAPAPASKQVAQSGVKPAPSAGQKATPSLAPSKLAPSKSIPYAVDPDWEAMAEAAIAEELRNLRPSTR